MIAYVCVDGEAATTHFKKAIEASPAGLENDSKHSRVIIGRNLPAINRDLSPAGPKARTESPDQQLLVGGCRRKEIV